MYKIKQDKKYYITAVSSDRATVRSISKEMSQDSSLNLNLKQTEIDNIISLFLDKVQEHLKKGDLVKLQDFGTLSVSIKSKGEDSESNVTEQSVIREKTKINFRVSSKLKETLRNLEYEQD